MWEMVTAVATVGIAVIALLAIYFQNKSFQLTLAADLSMKLEEKFNDKEFRKLRAKAALSLKTHDEEGEAEEVFDFFDTIGLFTRRGALDERFVHSMFFHWINLYWIAGRDHIRKRQKGAKCLWNEFEYLYARVVELEKKQDPNSKDIELSANDLALYLDDEIALTQSTARTSVDQQ